MVFRIFVLSQILAWLFSSSLYAQSEYNVKLRDPQLLRFFERTQRESLRSTDATAELKSRFAFLEKGPVIQSLASPRATRSDESIKQWYTLRFPAETSQSSLQNSGAFEWVEPNRRVPIHEYTLADPPRDDSVSQQWYHSFIQTFDAWDYTRGAPSIKIGIIDTGIDYNHPEFSNQLWVNTAEDLNRNGRLDPWPTTEVRDGISGDFDGIDNDGNGFSDDVIGYDFTDQPRSPFGSDFFGPDPDPLDDNAHGTLVAGVIGARADNREGGAGIAPDCKLVTLRAFASDGGGEDDDIARAIIYAADNGVHILNFSFGDTYPSQMMQEAIRYAYAQGVIMVSSAGNGGGDNLHYPSGYDEVISVSATTQIEDGEGFWPVSSWGVTVDLAAPGTNILAPTLRDLSEQPPLPAYRRVQGTSFSAPMVSAAAALLLAYKGTFSPQQVRGMLTTTADDLFSPNSLSLIQGWDHLTGAGRLNIRRLLDAVGTSHVAIDAPTNDQGVVQDSIWIIGTVLEPEFAQYHIEFQPGTAGQNEWISIVSNQVYQVVSDTLAVWRLDTLPEGEYTLRLRVEKTDGFSVEDRIRVIRDLSPPETKLLRHGPIWDNAERKYFMIVRSNDACQHVLHYRLQGSPVFKQLNFDRITRNGEFLLGNNLLSPGNYEFYIESTNQAGLVGRTPTELFSYQPRVIPGFGFQRLAYTLPLARFLNETYDFDGDGLQEVVLSEYGPDLSVGKLKFYEFNGMGFSAADSVSFKSRLVPRDVADADGDGKWELLCAANDSSYILEQSAPGQFPKTEIWKQEGDTLFAVRFADTDADGRQELLMKNFRDYQVFEAQGESYMRAAVLPDVSPNYEGSIAPLALVEDFDGDQRPEIVYGDFDGDWLVYEHQGGNNYANTFVDTTALTRSGKYLCQGDFDGDGQKEIFIATHTDPILLNEAREYDAFYWWLRIFKSTGDNQYEQVWEDYLYDIDTRDLNVVTSGNLDDDPQEEIVFSTYPRTYLLEYEAGTYQMNWFYYGSLTTHHLIADFNGNGIQELGIGLIDTTYFFEKEVAYQGPHPVHTLTGKVIGEAAISLQWEAAPQATRYEVLRIRDPFGNPEGFSLGEVSATTYTDTGLEAGITYAYALRSRNLGLTPDISEFSNGVVLVPHELPRLDSVEVVGPRQLAVWFSQPVIDRPEDKSKFVLNGTTIPNALLYTGNASRRLLLGFDQPFTEGEHQLVIDTTFQDAQQACIDPNARLLSFNYLLPPEEDRLYLTQWEVVGDHEVILQFNYPLTQSALDSSQYTLSPRGKVSKAVWANEQEDAVRLTLEDSRVAALGYAVSVTVGEQVCSINELCISREGNTATFSSHQSDLKDVYVYPNPVRPHAEFDGLRFANLTRQADIRIFTLSGRYIQSVSENDGDGGVEWNMTDVQGKRIKPGIYLFHVTTEEEGVEDFVGKFSVVE